MKEKEEIEELLNGNNDLMGALSFNKENSRDGREFKKFNEVVGFSSQVLQVLENTFHKKNEIVFLDCSCGKSYLSFALNYILSKVSLLNTFFYGVDINQALIEKCEKIRVLLGYDNMYFEKNRIIDVQPGKPIDIVIALHACDVATDEAIAKGLKLQAEYIIVVPCCENAIRNRLRTGHPLVDLTDFGLLRYRFANVLTEALRAQFLEGAGYHVKLTEITSPRFTPKNLMIIARKKKGNKVYSMDKFKNLDGMFNTEFVLKTYFNEYETN
ncbi:MAG: SAM-dependent methyltransferase [Candidatus Brocadiaceae bacterium]|nr:SAM-dependent methyltransferase [Candidatus Brocadiaceae bacterium]